MVRIPDIPVAQRRLETISPTATQSISEASSFGRSVSELGTGIVKAGKLQQQEDEKFAKKQSNDSIADFQLGQLQDFEDFKLEHEDNETFTETWTQQFDERAGNILKGTEGLSQELLSGRIADLRFDMTKNAITHQAKQKVALKKQQSSDAINTYSNLITQNPDSWEDVLFSAETTFDASKNFMDKATHEKFMADGMAELGEAKIRAEILRNTEGAEKLLKTKEMASVLDPDTMKILNKELLQQKKEDKKDDIKALAAERARGAIERGEPIDGKDKANQKAIDAFFEVSNSGEDMSNLDASAANKVTEVAQRTGYLPKEGESILRSFLTTGNNDQKQYAVDTISRLQEEAPNSLAGFNQNEISEALLATKYTRAGIPPDQAFTFATEQVNPLNKDVIDLRKKVSTEEIKDMNVSGKIEDVFETFFFFEPDLPDNPKLRDSMTSEYKTIWEANFLNSV